MEIKNIKTTAKTLNITEKQVTSVLEMLEEGNTVPFIARYRKERTGALDEDAIRSIESIYEYACNLEKRKEDVIRLIEEKGMMNEDLKASILQSEKISQVDEIYRPYKEKKLTRAMIAINNGLEPLAKLLQTCPQRGNLELLMKPYINDQVPTLEDVRTGVIDIIASRTAENPRYRKYVKDMLYKTGKIVTKAKKNHKDENQTYQMYYDHNEPISRLANHRILAINRAENEKVITVTFDFNETRFLEYIERGTIRRDTFAKDILKDAVKEGFKRLLYPSIEREIRAELTAKAHEQSLDVFSINLEKLLMQAPLKGKTVLGVDPAFRTGCKLAVVNEYGKVLTISKFFPTLPKKDYSKDKAILENLLNTYHCDIIAIGNGTASRETEAFIAAYIKEKHSNIKYVIVSEAGASVYSASKIAQEEFPDYHVEERSAVSIARRIQDPLAELVKIEPKAISVGQYQHDMNQKELENRLTFVVEKVVNQVGVDVNTASSSLLQYVSGCSKTIANNIIEYRNEHTGIRNRKELLKVKKLGPKTYEQCAGFLRILDGTEKLDETGIHPESYSLAVKILNKAGYTNNYIGTKELSEALNKLNKDIMLQELNCDSYTYDDVIAALKAPMRSPRDEYPTAVLKSDILHVEDLKPGDELQGTVRNVVNFGAFVDIGLKNDGLVHISKLSKKHIDHPFDVVNVGDIVTVYVDHVDDRGKVSLTMIH